VLTSSGTDAYATYASAIGSLKGSRHGGANLKVVEMIDNFKTHVTNWEDENQVADHIAKIIRKEENDRTGLIYGMGHAVYTLSDPRAVILKKKAFELAKGSSFEKEFHLIENIEKMTPIVFKEVKHDDKVMCANVDLYSGFVYRMLGIPKDIYTPLFASARIAGWSAHRMEEMLTGKRIIRPAYKAIVKERAYTPLCDR
jgi:citrate synthase